MYQQGTVASWNDDRGMGFIRASDGSGDRFVHRSALIDGQRLELGAEVMFESGYDDVKQKPIVVRCSGAVANGTEDAAVHALEAQAGELLGQGLQMGTVKTWIEERGMGFITPAQGGDDLFVHRSFLTDGVELTVGGLVTYEPDFDQQKQKHVARNVSGASPKGGGKGHGVVVQPPTAQPPTAQLDAAQANAIIDSHLGPAVQGLGVNVPTLLLIAGYTKNENAGYGKSGAAVAVQRASPYGATGIPKVVQAPPRPPSHPPKLIGIVKSWIEERGMGFVSPNVGGDDHFVHRSFLQDGNSLQIGSTVQFEAGWDAGKGKPTAQNVTGAVTLIGGQAANHMPPQAPRAVPPPAVPVGLHSSPVAPQAPQTQEGLQVGIVKAWHEQRGMGFIGPLDGGADLFVHRSSLTDGNSLTDGAHVYFEPSWDAMKNKPIAKNVSGAITLENTGANLM